MALLSVVAAAALAAVPADEIHALPGWAGALPSRQYSGYLSFGPNNRKHIHYWYVESTGKDPSAESTPTLLWMNGGPGCSSLDGWYYEHGPFRGNSSDPKRLVENPVSWAQKGNLLYIEAPVGVGFSYSDDPATDYKQNDDLSSQDNLQAVMKFFELYPELKSHPFFITGESYGGIYVPTLAEAIVWANGNQTYTGAKLTGIAVGNGCTGSEIGVCGGQRDQYDTEYLLGQAFVSHTMKTQIRAECSDWSAPSKKCETLLGEMATTISNVNLYNIYGECIQGRSATDNKILRAPLGNTRFYSGLGGPDACIDSRDATEYFTQDGIVNATHVKPISFKWATCQTAPGWSYNSNRKNLPRDTYPLLVENMRVLIYNGDWDACVPYNDNEAWTSSMGFDVLDAWHPWTYTSEDDGSKQVGGYATRYQNNFTFITVRGGRHEVPETAGFKALEMVDRLVSNRNF
eukprot:TRINITY_DN216_c0_g1_i1.p1 TRINITY_DN216_c0_g1~~TRINITY_DN216_c0_g1_i1.p1  ORF type:complete len:472 (+),score=190.02 TRINITY_DN216_c0_g1_i1:39-1418(+)